MSDIVDFLMARLDEDEGVAREAVAIRRLVYANQPRVVDPDFTFVAWTDHPAGTVVVGPERMLGEVRAKRCIVDLFPDSADGDGWNEAGAQVLQHLAAAYSEHPDYRDEWRV